MVSDRPAPSIERFGMQGGTPPAPGKRPAVSSWVPIRTLHARHRRQILDHLIQLDEQDRYLRFGCQAPLEHLTRYAASIDFKRDEVFGIFNRRLRLVAMAHLAALPPMTSPAGPKVPCMEFGVSVLPQSRGRGLGQRLFEHAIMHARNHHAGALMIHALTENRPMIRIALRAGAKLETDGRDTEAWLSLPKDTLGSHVESSLLAIRADVVYGVKRHALRLKEWLSKVSTAW
jgi:RimJ/RimL family protein N-acetyltransferase